MKLRFSLRTEFRFSEPVSRHVFRIRALPPDLPGQRVTDARLTTEPATPLADLVDPVFGNRTFSGRIDAPHDGFVVAAEGLVERDVSVIDRTPPEPYCINATALTRPGARILALSKALEADRPADETAQVLYAMKAVHAAFCYTPGTTSTGTTAEAALEAGRGVCQDYAHVMIALLRLWRIPALYVAGLMQGTGATHAWVRAFADGRWIEVDPTHDRAADETYLTLARGCDFADAALERGVFCGAARQTILTEAEVTPSAEGSFL